MNRTIPPNHSMPSMTSRGSVVGLQILSEHRQTPAAVTQVRALVDHGLEGDVHGKKNVGSGRQLLIVERSALQALGLRPGDLREQITVDFPPLETLSSGTLLRIGQATCELTGPCEPCSHIGKLLDVPDVEKFQASLDGRRGQLARITAVDRDGTIRLGDPVVLIGARAPSPA